MFEAALQLLSLSTSISILPMLTDFRDDIAFGHPKTDHL
jgi:hypothetical protein